MADYVAASVYLNLKISVFSSRRTTKLDNKIVQEVIIMKTMYVGFKELVNCGDLIVTKHNSDGSIEEINMTSAEFIKYINDKRRRGVNGITALPDRDFYIAKYDLNYTDFLNVGMAALYAGCDDHEAINSLKSYINKVQDIFSKLACEDFDAAEALRKDSKEFLADLISKAKAFLNHASMEAFADTFVESLNTLHSSLEDEDDFDIMGADYDDAEELRLIEECNRQEMGKFEDTINNISEAANELRHEVFGYIPQALDNLVAVVSKIADPYLNMMYADEDFEAFINYDPSDYYCVDDFAECYAA